MIDTHDLKVGDRVRMADGSVAGEVTVAIRGSLFVRIAWDRSQGEDRLRRSSPIWNYLERAK